MNNRFPFVRPAFSFSFLQFRNRRVTPAFRPIHPVDERIQKSPLRSGLFNTPEDFYFFSLLPIKSGMLPSLCAPSRPLRL